MHRGCPDFAVSAGKEQKHRSDCFPSRRSSVDWLKAGERRGEGGAFHHFLKIGFSPDRFDALRLQLRSDLLRELAVSAYGARLGAEAQATLAEAEAIAARSYAVQAGVVAANDPAASGGSSDAAKNASDAEIFAAEARAYADEAARARADAAMP
jgi:hypothetical protein